MDALADLGYPAILSSVAGNLARWVLVFAHLVLGAGQRKSYWSVCLRRDPRRARQESTPDTIGRQLRHFESAGTKSPGKIVEWVMVLELALNPHAPVYTFCSSTLFMKVVLTLPIRQERC